MYASVVEGFVQESEGIAPSQPMLGAETSANPKPCAWGAPKKVTLNPPLSLGFQVFKLWKSPVSTGSHITCRWIRVWPRPISRVEGGIFHIVQVGLGALSSIPQDGQPAAMPGVQNVGWLSSDEKLKTNTTHRARGNEVRCQVHAWIPLCCGLHINIASIIQRNGVGFTCRAYSACTAIVCG